MSTINNASIGLLKTSYDNKTHKHPSYPTRCVLSKSESIHTTRWLVDNPCFDSTKKDLVSDGWSPKMKDILKGSSPSRHAYIHQLTHQVHTNQKHPPTNAQVTPHAYDLEVKAVSEEGMTKVWNFVPRACRMITCPIGSINLRWFSYRWALGIVP